MQNKMQHVDKTKLQHGNKVLISYPKGHVKSNRIYNNKEGMVDMINEDAAIILLNIGGITGTVGVKYEYLFVPTETQQEPVLIELEKVAKFLEAKTFTRQIAPFINYFAKPENQYQPKHPVKEPVLKKGDLVITNPAPYNKTPACIRMKGCSGRITEILIIDGQPFRYFVHDVAWEPGELSLQQKSITKNHPVPMTDSEANSLTSDVFGKKPDGAEPIPTADKKHLDNANKIKLVPDNPVTTFHIEPPFDLSTAKELIKQGGKANELALQYYPELKEKQLPMSFEDLERISGWFIDHTSKIRELNDSVCCHMNSNLFPTKEHAAASLALAQLLQLRKAWIDIECKGWLSIFETDGIFEGTYYVIERYADDISVIDTANRYGTLTFPNHKIAQRFLVTFADLIKTAFLLP